MTTYIIDPRKNSNYKTDKFLVNADSYQDAADIAVRKIHRNYARTIIARRDTGDMHGSGMFQGYVPSKMGGLNSVGSYFHVSVATDGEKRAYA